MALTQTPVCEFGTKAPDFDLPGTDGRNWTLEECLGEQGTLVMFICNHCPYVKAIRERLVETTGKLLKYGVRSVAIMPNDPKDYPEDSFENMKLVADQFEFPFPYLFDATQETARRYGAVCTPDFFGYNSALELQYRGRLDKGKTEPPAAGYTHELLEAMRRIGASGTGPAHQIPSMGCSIKWRK